ncbi:MAG TPA: S24 family peptidase [Candidatus Paceibacterota bacterium]
MHPIQEKLLKVIDEKNIGILTLRQIGDLTGEKLPQKIKHHLSQLERKGFILIDRKKKKISRVSRKTKAGDFLVAIPIVGSANCGPATIYADQNIEGYLKISKRLAPNKKRLFALRAEGNSLNRANIEGKNIESGDYVIVDSENASPRDGDYVVSIIDEMANIKKYRLDRENSRIALLSESTQEYTPIFIHEADNFKISGKVIDVVKKF